ncbi:MAG: response regulator transcription factor [Muribaculaceae bacterium]|nr:response regulator transcription factor [Muribaculaceae bacterium]
MKDELKQTHIVVADNSAVVRSGMAMLLQHDGLQVCECENTQRLRALMAEQSPDMVLVNPLLVNVVELRQLRAVYGDCRWIALLTSAIGSSIMSMFDGQVSIYDSADEIRRKLMSEAAPRRKMTESDAASQLDALSEREREVVVCAVRGMTNRDIAQRLGLSIHTVISHRRNINHKLQIHTPSGLTIFALKTRLVNLADLSPLHH